MNPLFWGGFLLYIHFKFALNVLVPKNMLVFNMYYNKEELVFYFLSFSKIEKGLAIDDIKNASTIAK